MSHSYRLPIVTTANISIGNYVVALSDALAHKPKSLASSTMNEVYKIRADGTLPRFDI